MKQLIQISRITDNLVAEIASRDVALWIKVFPARDSTLIRFLRLPWRLVICETYEPSLLNAVVEVDNIQDALTRKRGFVQIIESDPSRIQLPERCLPIYLLRGKNSATVPSSFDDRLRRLTMLEALRRAAPREILVVGTGPDALPEDLKDLWSSGFRSQITFVTDALEANSILTNWLQTSEGTAVAALLPAPSQSVIQDIVARYDSVYPEERHVIRIRDVHGVFHKLDVTEADEPERPILETYSLIEERDLSLLAPQELAEGEFQAFFRDSTLSWRPYAAGLPWIRDDKAKRELFDLLGDLDSAGAEENCVAYIAAEPGAGGTTFARALAWEAATQGYPVLVAKAFPFVPDALPVTNFLIRIHALVEARLQTDQPVLSGQSQLEDGARRYQAPWLIVFDSLHWEYRDSELIRFRNELEKSGRPVCLLVVRGPYLSLEILSTSNFKKLAELNHAIELEEARRLGEHLNLFLRTHGKQRERWHWDRFYEDHTVRYTEGIAAFWVVLSFWIQGLYDMSESIQEWMYKCFKQNTSEPLIKEAILRIAALSSERLPLPDVLLPTAKGKWPASQLLTDRRSDLAALGLIRIAADGQKYWALAHDILGRFLINALFFDFKEREALGYGHAKDSAHLRFLLLQRLSQEPLLGEAAYRAIGEDFATSIFKIDPDRGHGDFIRMWREVLEALDSMPRPLRDTSRVFRHHCAVSRRRIAHLEEKYYGVTLEDQITLLNRAIDDIKYALEFIEYAPGSESNLNLYNSLANAYFDLAEVEGNKGVPRERLIELRSLANDATRRAYSENPTSSYVIETFVKNLLQDAEYYSDQKVDQCLEALGILFPALASNEAVYRATHLSGLADRAVRILLKSTPESIEEAEPQNATDVLVQAWRTLVDGIDPASMVLSALPVSNREHALEKLAHPAGHGNMQVVRLTYDLTCLNNPLAFKEQLDLVEQLSASEYRFTPQLRLEYGILLFENNRPLEGEKVFKFLRQLWRQNELAIQVPERLRWLRTLDGNLQVVHATSASDWNIRPTARVQEFGSAFVPLRPEEFGIRELTQGQRFSCHVSFGHNGPFLRPLTARAPVITRT